MCDSRCLVTAGSAICIYIVCSTWVDHSVSCYFLMLSFSVISSRQTLLCIFLFIVCLEGIFDTNEWCI